jgi:Ca2+/Na+ antiporter
MTEADNTFVVIVGILFCCLVGVIVLLSYAMNKPAKKTTAVAHDDDNVKSGTVFVEEEDGTLVRRSTRCGIVHLRLHLQCMLYSKCVCGAGNASLLVLLTQSQYFLPRQKRQRQKQQLQASLLLQSQ